MKYFFSRILILFFLTAFSHTSQAEVSNQAFQFKPPKDLTDVQAKHLVKLFVTEMKDKEEWLTELSGLLKVDETQQGFWFLLMLTMKYFQLALNGDSSTIALYIDENPEIQEKIINVFANDQEMTQRVYDYLQQNPSFMASHFSI